ncbi:MAG: hypothetical protein FWG40_02420 [Peptococcaceae bacterium]|nr:hypothetical protein [Peptococcaceae bacterium]
MIVLKNTVFQDVWLDALYDGRIVVSDGLDRIRRVFAYKTRVMVYAFQDVQQLADYLGMDLPVWVKGTGFGDKILVVGREGWIDDSEDSVFGVVLHEFTHLAVAESFAATCPLWLNEGLAIYFSGDSKFQDGENGVDGWAKGEYPFYERNYDDGDEFYFRSARMVFRLIEMYGEKDLIDHCRKCLDFVHDSRVGAENLRRLSYVVRV